jgi:hypothetical protein
MKDKIEFAILLVIVGGSLAMSAIVSIRPWFS